MSHCIFTKEAEQNLRDIADYTIEKWGSAQAEKYADILDQCFVNIAGKQAFAKRPFHHKQDVFYVSCEKHYIFYLDYEPPIIIAVLHQSMDVVKHLEHRTSS